MMKKLGAGVWTGSGLGLLLLAAAVYGQTARSRTGTGEPPFILPVSSAGPAQAAESQPAANQILRVIYDPHLGYRWLLLRDTTHPGGPGRLVRAATGRSDSLHASSAGAQAPDPAPPLPIIRAGDRLIVEEDTHLVEARLEAVALGLAWTGSPLPVRLKISGKVVHAVALGPGRAAFAPQMEARP